MGNANQTRGVRNCNPGNIRHSAGRWQGMRAEQTDKSFVQFTDIRYGLRAIWRTLETYCTRHGCDTIGKITRRWAPPGDGGNNPGLYAQLLENHACYPRDMQLISSPAICDTKTGSMLADDSVWHHIVRGICQVESQYTPTFGELKESWKMAFTSR